jgi:hypothetical protein
VLSATGVPRVSDDQQNGDDPLTQAIHKQWLRYLQSIQIAHQDKHWRSPPYDDWLQRHPEDRGVLPAASMDSAPQANSSSGSASPTEEQNKTAASDTSNSAASLAAARNTIYAGLLIGGATVAGLVTLYWRRKRKGR